ncbi:MAG: HD domain-containing protein [Aigarchaeota archaeon]|nr:HD domain-containing protein [Candidatus Pelearchaeum maunauluense]
MARRGSAKLSGAIQLLEAGLGLKRVKRSGWVEAGVKNPESVADHGYSLALLSMVAADLLGMDAEKAMRMALLHDLPEAFTDDLTPREKNKVRKEMLNNIEGGILRELTSGLPDGVRRRYLELYREYVEGRSREARLLHALDRLEMALEASRLQKEQNIKLERFMRDASRNPTTREIMESIAKQGGKKPDI